MIIPDGMLDPYLTDPDDKPFSYYAHPTDPIGAMILLAILGALLGGLGYLIRSRA